MEYKYDVALSFSGNDRQYVRKVAEILKRKGLSVFYDEFEELDLWGKNLGIHFDFVYRKAAKYCIPFISSSYKDKVWTNHEIKTAISRAINTNEEYILPVRFDDTEIDGIRPTISYLDLRQISEEQLADKIFSKVSQTPDVPVTEKEQSSGGKVLLSCKVIFTERGPSPGCILQVHIVNVEQGNRYFYEPSFKLTDPLEGGPDSFYLLEKLKPVNFPHKLEHGEAVDIDYVLYKPSVDLVFSKLPEQSSVVAVVTTTLGEKYKSNLMTVEEIIKNIQFADNQ